MASDVNIEISSLYLQGQGHKKMLKSPFFLSLNMGRFSKIHISVNWSRIDLKLYGSMESCHMCHVNEYGTNTFRIRSGIRLFL